MHVPKAFEEHDISKLHELIRQYNFGILFSQSDERPYATHLPFMIDPKDGEFGTLIGHFAKTNPHWESLNENSNVLVVFQGPHSYISPSWYINQVTVPTWNYAVVHAYGNPQLTHDKDEMREMVSELVEVHEAAISPRWELETAAPVMDAELNGIVGFKIQITKLEGKYKFNQNRTLSDQIGVVKALENSEDPLQAEVAEIMKANVSKKRESS